MKNLELVNTLKELGLTDNEAGLYLAGLSLKSASITQLASTAEMKRTTAYSVLESLKQMGLMKIEIRGFKHSYVAEDPKKLLELIDRRKERLERDIGKFQSLYQLPSSGSMIQYYEGLQGIKTVLEGMIRDVKPGDWYYVLGTTEIWQRLDPPYFKDFQERRAKLDIVPHLILERTPSAIEQKRTEKERHIKVKLLPEGTKFTMNLSLFPKRVVNSQIVEPLGALVIENQSSINTYKELFEMIWNSLPD